MKQISHRQVRALFHSDEIQSAEEENRVELHLSKCTQCRAYASVAQQLESGTWSPYKETQLPPGKIKSIEEGLAAKIHKRMRTQRLLSPIPTIAWAAVAILFVLTLSWTLDNLRAETNRLPEISSSGGINESEYASTPVPSSQPVRPDPNPLQSRILGWIGDHLLLAGLIVPVVMGVAGIAMAAWRPRERAAWAWLLFTLFSFTFIIITLWYLIDPWGMYGLELVFFPGIMTIVSAIILQLWSKRVTWTRQRYYILIAFAAIIGAALSLHVRSGESSFLTWLMLILGLVLAILWQGLELHGWWRCLTYPIVFLSLGVATWLIVNPFSSMLELPMWLQVVLGAAGFLLPAVAVIIVAVTLSKDSPISWKRVLAGSIILLLLYAISFALIWTIAITDKISDDGISALMIIYFASAGAVTAVIELAWELSGRRKLAAIGAVLLFILLLVPAVRGPSASAETLTQQRAETINKAILDYHEQKARYPSTLNELSPRYLWIIPQPVTYWKRMWCYEGGGQYYRLGYYHALVYYHSPRGVNVVRYASEGSAPISKWDCEIQLEQDFKEWYEKYPWEPGRMGD